MAVVVLEPHNDDVALFCAWQAIRWKAHIVTVLRSVNQEANGITAAEREAESARVAEILGCTWEQWPYGDDDPDWQEIRARLEELGNGERPTRIFAPWPEPKGHPQHSRVGELAEAVFGSERVTFYTTYRYGGPRTVGREVEPEPWMIPLKLRALACYESQMLRGPRRFFLDSLREYELP